MMITVSCDAVREGNQAKIRGRPGTVSRAARAWFELGALFESIDKADGIAGIFLRVGENMRAVVVELDRAESKV